MKNIQTPGFIQKASKSNKTERAKHSDLITLPESVKGTNCGNCKYVQELENDILDCRHEEVAQTVTERMCCSYWDHQDVKRPWL